MRAAGSPAGSRSGAYRMFTICPASSRTDTDLTSAKSWSSDATQKTGTTGRPERSASRRATFIAATAL